MHPTHVGQLQLSSRVPSWRQLPAPKNRTSFWRNQPVQPSRVVSQESVTLSLNLSAYLGYTRSERSAPQLLHASLSNGSGSGMSGVQKELQRACFLLECPINCTLITLFASACMQGGITLQKSSISEADGIWQQSYS
jgi:hypothetical protein